MLHPETTEKGLTPIPYDDFLSAVRRLKSADAQEALMRVYACATLFKGEPSDEAAAACVGEAAAVRAMQRIATGQSTDVTADLAEAEKWALWHAEKLAAEAKMEASIAAVVTELMSSLVSISPTTPVEARETTAAVAVAVAASEADNTTTLPTANTFVSPSTHAADTRPLMKGDASAESTNRSCAPALNREAVELHKSIFNDTPNPDDLNKMNVNKKVEEYSEITVPALAEQEDAGDATAAGNASTRTPSPREASRDGQCNNDFENGESDATLHLSTETSSEEASGQRPSLAFPKLCPPTMSVQDIVSAEETKLTTRPHPLKRLCFEDYGMHFTQADFDAACEELRQQRGGGGGADKNNRDGELHAAEKRKPSGSAAPSPTTAAAKLLTERVPPPLPPRQVEDAGLHYVRRQLSVRHLQPFACPLKALMLRLAEGDTAGTATFPSSTYETEDSQSPRLSDPLMRRMWTELTEVCVKHPVPRVRVRPDAQVYRKDRGTFKADEVRVQLHVEVVPVSGPMMGETVHVWVRVPAGYPFVAPRAHLTVELPHHRCTGVAADKIPHLISLCYDAAVPDARPVCPAPLHTGEAEPLQPLHGAMNNHWRASLTLRHVLSALADLFNADAFAETARELQNENLMHNGLQRARVNMYDEEGSTAPEATAAAALTASSARRSAGHCVSPRTTATGNSSNDDEYTAGEDSIGLTSIADDRAAPSYVLLCNGPFFTKSTPATTVASSATQMASSVSAATELSVHRPCEVDGDEDGEGSVHTAESAPSRRSTASRRRARKSLAHHDTEGDRLCGPWRGCWGHVLYRVVGAVGTAPSASATTTGGTTYLSSPIGVGSNHADSAGAASAAAAAAALNGETTAFAKSANSSPNRPAPQSLISTPLSLQTPPKESAGTLFIRLKHHVPTAAAATVRLVHVPAQTLREQGTASATNTPLRRTRGRRFPQSTWVAAALGTSSTSVPAGTAWTSSAPADMEKDVIICVHDDHDDHEDERKVETPSELTATQPGSYERQHVNLHHLRETSAVPSSTASANNNVAAATAETNSTYTPESTLREEAEGNGERWYAVVVDVPEGQAVSFVFSSDEAACRSISWGSGGSAEAEAEVQSPDASMSAGHEDSNCASASAVVTAAQWDGDEESSRTSAAHGGLLVELPYEEWQFHAASATAALSNGAVREEDIHPHWPRNVRFHGGHRVVPLTLKETTFRMYQLLQNTQLGSRSSVPPSSSYLAAAPHARVRQVYGGKSNVKDQEMMTRRYGFWGWRNVMLPVLAVETRELVQTALQVHRSDDGDSPPHKQPPVVSAKMLATALCSWEVAAVEDFGAACVQLHRDPDASHTYNAPFRPFAVLRTLTLTVAYALEVMQVLHKTQTGTSTNGNSDDAGAESASAEATALLDCLTKVLWNATVLAVVTAAVKPAFLDVCVTLVDYVKKGDCNGIAEGVDARTTSSHFHHHCEREVQLALSQLSELQRDAAQVLAASTMSAFADEVAALAAATPSEEHSAWPAFSDASLAERVTRLLNAPGTPLLGSATFDDSVAAGRVSAFTKLIMPSCDNKRL
ncbi:hypothetical protein ABB37_06212 [Leptomonas pyrrhocoris]|uniref:Uncharacterized protein n=1 Tax=Leptomonas pyrrhocoris TaxID=157538 RepID=A0A0N0DU96_LEPPY|nr:hypothetical protein ABB37_06212 [Leptomonas pyrrhocoris]KPA78612.1 hypothetical protein ABB37_06212 [Leptomonas pyrrhocoris]|eukprot:XP_015657051.1 hypothetical protein ABB37_06212 [Leptomonas pyrrhocoris]